VRMAASGEAIAFVLDSFVLMKVLSLIDAVRLFRNGRTTAETIRYASLRNLDVWVLRLELVRLVIVSRSQCRFARREQPRLSSHLRRLALAQLGQNGRGIDSVQLPHRPGTTHSAAGSYRGFSRRCRWCATGFRREV